MRASNPGGVLKCGREGGTVQAGVPGAVRVPEEVEAGRRV